MTQVQVGQAFSLSGFVRERSKAKTDRLKPVLLKAYACEECALGLQRRMGLRAAVTSSRRLTRVECGAVLTISGFVAASSAIERIASTNRSHSCFDSDSVGSIISAPGTISGNAVV